MGFTYVYLYSWSFIAFGGSEEVELNSFLPVFWSKYLLNFVNLRNNRNRFINVCLKLNSTSPPAIPNPIVVVIVQGGSGYLAAARLAPCLYSHYLIVAVAVFVLLWCGLPSHKLSPSDIMDSDLGQDENS